LWLANLNYPMLYSYKLVSDVSFNGLEAPRSPLYIQKPMTRYECAMFSSCCAEAIALKLYSLRMR